MESLRRSVDLNPDLVPAWNKMGVVVLHLNQQDQARQALKAIGYRLTEFYLVPPGLPTPGFHEKPLRLPICWWNFQLPPEALVRMPEVEPPPSLVKDHVTFGSLNNFFKLNPITRDA